MDQAERIHLRGLQVTHDRTDVYLIGFKGAGDPKGELGAVRRFLVAEERGVEIFLMY